MKTHQEFLSPVLAVKNPAVCFAIRDKFGWLDLEKYQSDCRPVLDLVDVGSGMTAQSKSLSLSAAKVETLSLTPFNKTVWFKTLMPAFKSRSIA